MPKVSVVIPTYNRGGVIRDTIGSVLSQTERDLEVIVVDDGSTDDTRSNVEGLIDNRVVYFFKTNGGPASARNLGLSKAKGEYIAFLDSDDYWPENYLEVMVSRLENNSEFGVAYSPFTIIYPDGREIKSYKRPEGKSGWLAVDLFKSGFVWISATIIRRSFLENFYFDEALRFSYEDSDFFLRLSARTQFLFVREVDAFYRSSPDSLSAIVGTACTRILTLERFYYHLGGDKIVPARIARRKISHAARKVAEDRRKKGEKTAALALYKHSIRYWPYDLRLYVGFTRALLLSRSNDPQPDWEMPHPLQGPIGPNRFI